MFIEFPHTRVICKLVVWP